MSRYTRFWTKSGSEYVIDHDERIWRRAINPNSPYVRTSNGVFWMSTTIEIGRSVYLLCPPLAEGAILRVISTTPVILLSHE